MPEVIEANLQTEEEFAVMVDRYAAEPGGAAKLTALLREDHSVYDQRGAAASTRMRGWVLCALARGGVPPEALVFVLEELDTGVDPYLVAAAARALRSFRESEPAFAKFVLQALANIRYHDEPVTFAAYGEYATTSNATSPLRELLETAAWLVPFAPPDLAGELRRLRSPAGGLPRKYWPLLDRALALAPGAAAPDCCALPAGLRTAFSWMPRARRSPSTVSEVVFEDHDGRVVPFPALVAGHATIVVFFYTRCDNPLKCSLTVTKLARLQRILAERGLAEQIHTAAITYDPAFDHPERLRRYGESRGVRLDAAHRMLRTTRGFDDLRNYFELGVNFIESLVNRHRLEVYVLDAEGRIAATFERLQWNETDVADRAIAVRQETGDAPAEPSSSGARSLTAAAPLASLAVAFFPKCAVCWAAYLSLFGIAGLEQVPYAPWIRPLLIGVMVINLFSLWLRCRATGSRVGFYLSSLGAAMILGGSSLSLWGVCLTTVGSVWTVLANRKTSTEPAREPVRW